MKLVITINPTPRQKRINIRKLFKKELQEAIKDIIDDIKYWTTLLKFLT